MSAYALIPRASLFSLIRSRSCAPATWQSSLSSRPNYPQSHQPLATNAMSSTSKVPATSSESSRTSTNFQLIFYTALKAYEKKTKGELLAHPLVSQLQTCDSPASILAVLQAQVDDIDQARKSDDRLTKWLIPTVNVLLTFSATIGGGVSLVRIKYSRCRTKFKSKYLGFLTCNCDLRRCWCPPPGQYIIFVSPRANLDIEAR